MKPHSLFALPLVVAIAGSIRAQTHAVTLDEGYGDFYKATATLTKDSSQTIDSWLGRIEPGGTIRELGRGVIQEGESNPVLFTYGGSNDSCNGQLLPGESTTFGFIVQGDSDSLFPDLQFHPRTDPGEVASFRRNTSITNEPFGFFRVRVGIPSS